MEISMTRGWLANTYFCLRIPSKKIKHMNKIIFNIICNSYNLCLFLTQEIDCKFKLRKQNVRGFDLTKKMIFTVRKYPQKYQLCVKYIVSGKPLYSRNMTLSMSFIQENARGK